MLFGICKSITKVLCVRVLPVLVVFLAMFSSSQIVCTFIWLTIDFAPYMSMARACLALLHWMGSICKISSGCALHTNESCQYFFIIRNFLSSRCNLYFASRSNFSRSIFSLICKAFSSGVNSTRIGCFFFFFFFLPTPRAPLRGGIGTNCVWITNTQATCLKSTCVD